MQQGNGTCIGLVLVSALALSACGGGSSDGADTMTAGAGANSAPAITSQGEVSVAENTTLVLEVAASDAEGDALTFTLSGADASLFSIGESGLQVLDFGCCGLGLHAGIVTMQAPSPIKRNRY